MQRGVEGNEYVTLLSWTLNTYPGKELMQNPELRIDLSQIKNIKPLMKPDQVKSLDWQQRRAEFLCTPEESLLETVVAKDFTLLNPVDEDE